MAEDPRGGDTPPTFRVGDVVNLVSGGLPMTVWRVRKDQSGTWIYGAVWQTTSGDVKRDSFAGPELSKYEAKP